MVGEGVDERVGRLCARVAALEAELERERALRHAIIDHAPDFIVHCSLDGTIRFVNRLTPGLRLEDVVGAPLVTFAPPQYHEIIRAAVARVAATGEQETFESIAPGAHGVLTHFYNRIAPVLGEGQVTSLVLFSSDVDRLKQAENALREHDTKLRIIVEASEMGVWSLDLESGSAEADTRARSILGLADDPLDMNAGLGAVHQEDRPVIQAALEAAKTTGTYGPFVHRVVHPSGATRWVRSVGQVHMGTRGPTLLIGGLVDITSQKALEQQLAQAQKLESVGRLAGGVAHDFNNLLTAIFGSLEFAAQSLPPTASTHSELAEIRSAAERGATLTTQLLAFARRQLVEPRVLSLSALVTNVERLLQRVLGEDVDLAAVCQASGHVRVDPSQMERVLVNLATNARDAMPKGGHLTLETADMEIGADYAATHAEMAPGRYVMLAVSDTGAGIPPEHLPHVFEPFYTTKGMDQGTGLGLATCYGVVRQAGGQIQVYSEPGRGTTFRIYLPRVDEETERAAPSTPRIESRGHETLLLVEDEASVRRVVVRALRELGYVVLEAGSGREALDVALAHEGRIDVLVTDVVMPGMSGRELADQLGSVRPETKVLFVSGYTEHAIIHHGVLEPGIALLQKPFSPNALHTRIRRLFQ